MGGLMIHLSDNNPPPTPYENCIDETTQIYVGRGEYGSGADAEIREWCRNNFPASAP